MRHCGNLRRMKNSDLDRLAHVVGYSATRVLAVWFPGRVLYVPVNADPGHPIARLISLPRLQALVREYPGERFSMPTEGSDGEPARARRIAAAFAAGIGAREIAATLGLSVRRVEQIRVDLVGLGWLTFAQGLDTAMARRNSAPPEILGTGEVFDKPPTP